MSNPRSEVSYENEVFKAHPIIVLFCVTMKSGKKGSQQVCSYRCSLWKRELGGEDRDIDYSLMCSEPWLRQNQEMNQMKAVSFC